MTGKKKFTGLFTALATPFLNNKVDKSSFIRLIRFQIQQGIKKFVINGTTGESPCLSPREVKNLFQWARGEDPSLTLILGAGHNCTKKTIHSIHQAADLKADGALVVVPYYNKPSDRGLLRHFTRCAGESKIPLILYNVPSRTTVSLSFSGILKLSLHPQIVGIKEASSELRLGKKLLASGPKNFTVLSGDDFTVFDLCQKGARGGICVLSHILGKEMLSIFRRVKKGDKTALREYKKKYTKLLSALYRESNPVGIKTALYLMGIFKSPEVRSPLCTFTPQQTQALKLQLQKTGLL